MVKRYINCLKRFVKTQLIICICLSVLAHLLKESSESFVHRKKLEIFNRTSTGSVSQESLQILMCPMPRVHIGRVMHFGRAIPSMINYRFFWHNVVPKIHGQDQSTTFWKTMRYVVHCVMRKHWFKPTMPLIELIRTITSKHRTACWPEHILKNKVRYRAWRHLIRTTTKYMFQRALYEYLYSTFGTLDEGVMSDYEKLFQEMWQLRLENYTMTDWVNYISLNLTRQMDDEEQHNAMRDVTRPLQEIEDELVNTRVGAMCPTHVLHASSQHGFQRSRFTLKFQDHCPPEPKDTYPVGSYCVGTSDFYVTMYITPLNMFTDISGASTILPYRIAVDRQTIVHVSVKKIIHPKGECHNYTAEHTRVMCVEDCLARKVRGDISCTVPWILRVVERLGGDHAGFETCRRLRDYNRTINAVRRYYDEEESTGCKNKCPVECDELKIESRLVGSVYGGEDARIELIISDEMPVTTTKDLYGAFQFLCEVMGNLSFIIGVSLVALYDWLFGVALWLMGKIPFIPALPPILKHEVYPKEECSCHHQAAHEDHSISSTLSADSEEFLAHAFRTGHRRTDILSDGMEDEHEPGGHHRDSHTAQHHQRESVPGEDHYRHSLTDKNKSALPSFMRRKSFMMDAVAKTLVMTDSEIKRLSELHDPGRRSSEVQYERRQSGPAEQQATTVSEAANDGTKPEQQAAGTKHSRKSLTAGKKRQATQTESKPEPTGGGASEPTEAAQETAASETPGAFRGLPALPDLAAPRRSTAVGGNGAQPTGLAQASMRELDATLASQSRTLATVAEPVALLPTRRRTTLRGRASSADPHQQRKSLAGRYRARVRRKTKVAAMSTQVVPDAGGIATDSQQSFDDPS